LVVGLVLVGVNLRPALASLSPVLEQVAAGTGLSGATAGLLTTLPVVCLGVFAPAAAVLARRFGAERAVGGLLIALAAGIALRSAGGVVPLFAGTLAAGACIGVTGILLPGILKRDFGRQADLMTGVYTMALCLGAAVAAGASAPLSVWLGGWQPALAFWAIPVLLAFVAWWPHMRHAHGKGSAARIERVSLWNKPIAWQVTLYMGLQSSLAYCVFGWVPVILQDRGLSAVQSGMVVAVSIMVQLITALGGPFVARLGRDQRPAVLLMMLICWAGLLGCLYAPLSTLWWWAVLLGLGQGGNFSVALSLIVLRSADARVAGSLSAMTQGIGYTVAAAGPYLMGVLHDLTGSWAVMGWLFSAIALASITAGMLAGRNRTLHADQ
jgi:CP family cyanate transporter-like MFS transporter